MLRHLVFLLFFLFYVIISPLFYSISLTLQLFQFILEFFKRIYDPEVSEYLSGMDGMFASDSPYKQPEIVNHIIFFVDGHVSLEEVYDKMATAVEKCDQEGYPRLKQQLTSWMGFAAWRPCVDFRIRNHVRLLEGGEVEGLVGEREVNEDNACQVAHELSSMSFKAGESPWELLVCHSVSSKRIKPGGGTVLFFRLHHTLGDGATVFRVMSHMFEMEKSRNDATVGLGKTVEKGGATKYGSGSEDWSVLRDFIPSLYEAAEICAYRSDVNAIHKPWTPVKKKYYYYSLTVPMETIKRTSRSKKVAFSAVVCAAQALALRRFFEERGETVPKNVHAVISVPIEAPSDSISNNIKPMVLEYPTGEKDREKVCQFIHENIRLQKSALHPTFIPKVTNAVALLPVFIKFIYPGWLLTTCAGSNYPGFSAPISLNGKPVVAMPTISQLNSNIGMYFWSTGYVKDLAFTIGFRRDILQDRKSGQRFMEILNEEIQALANSA